GIIRLFSLDVEAAELTVVLRPTVNRVFHKLRELIVELCEDESQFENGDVALDGSCYDARRVRGIRGRGALGKTPVFGALKRGDKVCA
ncbi:MAG: IS1595 family transposase, partial [Rikenellaceae bacterium]|nr:IS1595 family transposase [Rikenellaceae bacterium]